MEVWTPAGILRLDCQCGGGLSEATVRRFCLRWNPRSLWDDPNHWGPSGDRIYLARGVVVPCEAIGELWYVKIRRFDS